MVCGLAMRKRRKKRAPGGTTRCGCQGCLSARLFDVTQNRGRERLSAIGGLPAEGSTNRGGR
ncbi:hypothetical protein CGRA01v4_11990 [Colletotrichum graminicola]|nr:hypothetical protein CGRA01v4_11990 [Colletotrichum graminicola]